MRNYEFADPRCDRRHEFYVKPNMDYPCGHARVVSYPAWAITVGVDGVEPMQKESRTSSSPRFSGIPRDVLV